MSLMTPQQCSTIHIGLQCQNKKCNKIIGETEWFYHCVKNSSNSNVHKGPYNYCVHCAELKVKKTKKELHFTYLKEGWMNKKPTNQIFTGKQFKKRYFRLSSEWKLWYYVDPNSVFNKDMIDLNYMTSIKKKHSNGFEIYETKGKNRWLFTCETTEERDEWYNIMILAYQSKQIQDANNGNNDNKNDTAKANDFGQVKQNMVYGDDDL